MVLVDVDSYLDDDSLSNKTDASLERMLDELMRERTNEHKNEATSRTSSSKYRVSSEGAKHASPLRKKKRSSSKSDKREETNAHKNGATPHISSSIDYISPDGIKSASPIRMKKRSSSKSEKMREETNEHKNGATSHSASSNYCISPDGIKGASPIRMKKRSSSNSEKMRKETNEQKNGATSQISSSNDCILPDGTKNASPIRMKKRSSIKSKRTSSSRSMSSSGALQSLPTIEEYNFSESESIEPNAPPLPASSVGETASRSIEIGNHQGNHHRYQPTRKGVRFGGVVEILIEDPAPLPDPAPIPYFQNMSRLVDPSESLPPSSHRNSDGSTSADDSSSGSDLTVIPELQMALDEEPTSFLDLSVEQPYYLQQRSRRRSKNTELCPTTSCFKPPTPNYQRCAYVLIVLLLAGTIAMVTVALLPKRRSAHSSPAAATNTTTVRPPIPVPIAVPMPVPTAAVAPTQSPTQSRESVRRPLVFLNCGGPSIQVNNRTWESDAFYSNFTVNSLGTKGRTTDPLCQEYVVLPNRTTTREDDDMVRDGDFDALFCTERWFSSLSNGGGYEIPVPAVGEYRIEFYFFEDVHTAARQRVFNISVEDQVIRENYDIFLRAEGAQKPSKLVATVPVNDRSVSIHLRASIGNPIINALAVFQLLDE